MPKSPPEVIAGRYELLDRLGKGGWSVTYKAFDRQLNALVALKLVDIESDEALHQFRREANAPLKLAHPNVLTIIDAGTDAGRAYLTSQFVSGGSLQAFLGRTGPLSIADAVSIVRDVGAGLDAIHRAGLVHRDLKPSNILLTEDGRAVVADLGLTLPRGEHSLTMTGLVMGTPAYMSPEQVRGERVDSRSDIFTLGVIVYEMLTGRQPFASHDVVSSLNSTLSAEPASLRSIDPRIPNAVGDAVLRAMAKSPDERYQTASDFVAALVASSLDRTHKSTEPARLRPKVDDDPVLRDDGTQLVAPLTRTALVSSGREDAPGWLLIAAGSRAGEQIPIRGTMVLGRSPEVDIKIDDPALSRRHARVSISDGRCVIQDLGSQNGLWVNGFRVDEAPLEDGDRVDLGGISLVFIAGTISTDGAVAAERRVREFSECWDVLCAANAVADDARFATASQQLVSGPLRQALGYRVDNAVPAYRGIVGHVVSNAMLWIRHSRFPILLLADRGQSRILADVVRQIELAQVSAFFAVIIVVPAGAGEARVAQLRQDLKDSVYRYDFVVLGRSEVEELIRRGSPRRLIQIMLEQGIELSGLSPYVVRGPVPEAMFFGREREIKLIMQSRQAYAIVGGRRIGKTSMLMKLARLLGYDPGWEPVYLNCEDKFEASEFLAGISDALDSSPVTDPRRLRRAFRERTARSGKKIVCLLDEVDELISNDAQLLSTWRALSFEETCRFILSGSRTLNRVGHDPGSPLFNFCEWITLRMLDRRSVAEIVTKPLGQLGFHLLDPEALIDQVMQATAGHPNLVQWMCDRLVKTASGRRLTASHVEDVARSAEFYEHLLETTWGDATPLERLITLAIERSTFTETELYESLARLGVTDTKAIAAALSTLRMFAVLDLQNVEYRIVNPCFLDAVRQARDVTREVGELKREVGA